jgi:hypothetical protein
VADGKGSIIGDVSVLRMQQARQQQGPKQQNDQSFHSWF